MRAGLRRILAQDSRFEVVAEAADGRQLLRDVERLRPDVVVVDISMPELNGIDATRAICRLPRPSRVLILSVHCTEATVVDAVEAGASGYLLKEAAEEQLHQAVAALAENKAFFSPAVSRLLANRLLRGSAGRLHLSTREREVVQLISEGHPLREIASRLFISMSTVKSHRANVMRKLGSRTTADLVRYAINHGLVAR